MDEDGFKRFLKRGGRSDNAAKRAIKVTRAFATYLLEQREGLDLSAVTSAELEAYVDWLDAADKTKVKGHLWGLRYYFQFVENETLAKMAGELRQQRITRAPFKLKDFRGVAPAHAASLAAAGIDSVEQMRAAGRTPRDRERLVRQTGVPENVVLELVKLSDLARVPGLKGIRARLYHDAGVDTIEKLAQWEPEEMRAMLTEFVARTGFDGIPPLPKEAQGAVATAKKLPRIIIY